MKKSLFYQVPIKMAQIAAVCLGFLFLFAAFTHFIVQDLVVSAIQLVIGLICLKVGNICRDATSLPREYINFPPVYRPFSDLLGEYENNWENYTDAERDERSKELDRAYIKLEASESAEFKNKKVEPTEERLMIKHILFERKNALYLRTP